MTSQNLGTARQYFLGIEGNQIGPLNEGEVVLRIENGEVNSETLVWYPGMHEWGVLGSLSVFEAALKSKSQSEKRITISPLAVNEKTSKRAHSLFAKDRITKILFGLLFLLFIVAGYFYLKAYRSKPKTPASVEKPEVKLLKLRYKEYAKSANDLLVDTKVAEQTLLKLIKQNPNDSVAQVATKALVAFYLKNQRYADAGRLLMAEKNYPAAAKFFSMDRRAASESESANFLAYENSADPNQRKFYLKQNIESLLKNSSPIEKVVERILLFEKEFPNEPSVYKYYTKTTDERIADLFPRISFFYSDQLRSYAKSTFSQINFTEEPSIELKKDPSGAYRVAGFYNGKNQPNETRSKQFHFSFWLEGASWVLVDTNLSREWKKRAEIERRKLRSTGLSGEQMLHILENTFRNTFPDALPHESQRKNEIKPQKSSP